MSAGEDGAEILRRHFVAIATSAYEDPVWGALDVEHEIAALRAWVCDPELGGRQFTVTCPELANDPEIDAVRGALENSTFDVLTGLGSHAAALVLAAAHACWTVRISCSVG